MLFFIRKNRKKKALPQKEKYTKAKVLDAMSKLLDWQYGKKGTEARDLYDAELESIRKQKEGRNQAQF